MIPSRETTLKDVLAVFWKHQRKVLLVFGAVCLGGLGYLVLSPREFRSEGKLYLRLGRENATLDSLTTMRAEPVVAVPPSRQDELNSAVDILKSRAVAERVVAALGADVVLGRKALPGAETAEPATHGGLLSPLLGKVKAALVVVGLTDQVPPEELAVLQLMQELRVSHSKDSNVIDVSYDSENAKLAQAIVGQYLECFLQHHIQLNRPQGAKSFLTTQRDQLLDNLSRSEEKLRALEKTTGLVSIGDQRLALVGRITSLENDLRISSAELASTDSEVKALENKLKELPAEQVVARTTGVTNEGTDGIRQQCYALEMEEQRLSAKMTADHPALQAVREQLAKSREIMKAQQPTREHITVGVNKGYEETELALLRRRPAQVALQAKVFSLQEQLTQTRQELAEFSDKKVQLSRAERELNLQETEYKNYVAALEQARIEDALSAERISNINIAQPASFESRAVSPRKPVVAAITLVLALVGGFCTAFGAEYLQRNGIALPVGFAVPQLRWLRRRKWASAPEVVASSR